MNKVIALLGMVIIWGSMVGQINPKNNKSLVVPGHASKGSMSFKINGQLYEADPAHAKGYAMIQSGLGYINGANSTTGILVGLELPVKGKGNYSIKGDKDGRVNFTIKDVMYWVKSPGDYLNIVITNTRQTGSLILLTGTFEGMLEDKNGHKVQVTEGKFSTESL